MWAGVYVVQQSTSTRGSPVMVCPPTSPSSVFTAECTGFSAAAACVVQYQLVAIRANDTCTDVSAQDDHWKVSLQRTLNFSAEVAAPAALELFFAPCPT